MVCADVIESLFKPIREAYKTGGYIKPGGYKAYIAGMEALEKQYRKTKGKGPQVRFYSNSVAIEMRRSGVVCMCVIVVEGLEHFTNLATL